MNPSTLGTGQTVLARANSATTHLPVQLPLPPGCANGGCIPPVGSSCVVQGVSIDPQSLFLLLSWAPPSGSPADLPLVFTYKSDTSNSTEFGSQWSGPYHRFAQVNIHTIPQSLNVNTPNYVYSYANNGSSFSPIAPGQNTVTGNSSTGWTETQPDGTKFVYDATGVLRTIRNRAGVRWTLTWDGGSNFVQAIQEPLGRRTSFVYNASNFVRRIVDPGGRITTLTVSASNDLTQIISPELCVTSFVYDGSHHLRAWVNPLGDRTTFIYQSGGGVVSAVQQPMGQRTTYSSTLAGGIFTTAITNPRSARTTLSFGTPYVITDPFGNQSTVTPGTLTQQAQTVTDARGVSVSLTYQLQNNGAYLVTRIQKTGFNSGTGQGQYSFLYNNSNQVKAVVDEIGNRASFTYDANGRLTRVTAPLGRITTWLYDNNSRVVATTDPLALRTSYAYDAASNPIRTTNPLGQITSNVFDLGNRVSAQVDPVGNRTSFSYDVAWNQVRVTNPLGQISSVVFDTTNRPSATIDPLGNRASMSYDLADDQIRTTNPLGFIATTVFDKLLRPVANIDPLLNRTTTTFDVGGRSIRIQDANAKITTTLYDGANRVAGTLNANGFRTSQVYDAAGRVVALVDANAHRNSFVYDAGGRQTVAIDPLGQRTSSQYDAASRKILRIDARGFRTSYVYDNDDRLTCQRYPDGTRVTHAYDNAGRRTLLNDATGRTSTTYDADGRTTLVAIPAGSRLTYAYDAGSRRKYLTEPEGSRFTYVFDAAGRTSYVANPQAQRATYSYDPANRVTGIHYANSTRTSYLYDNADRLLRVANLTSTNTTLSSFSYALDAAGNRKRVVEVTGNRVTWTYDNTYQLTNEQRSGSNSYNITYTYDPVGNRVALINGGVRTTSTYDAANELIKTQVIAGVTTITYDANGNTLLSRDPSNNRTSYTWDFENRMTQVTLPAAIVDTFTYNGDGQRTQKQDSTGTTKHVWDGENILLETDGSNIIQVVYTLEPMLYGSLISQRRSGVTASYLFDGLGSTIQLANSSGAATDADLYDSFGNVLLATGSSTYPFRFVGQLGYYKDVDLTQYWLRRRYFDPSGGRFVSRDPLATSLATMKYAYGGNNPVSLTDPSGLIPSRWLVANCATPRNPSTTPRNPLMLIPVPCIWKNWCGPNCPDPNSHPDPRLNIPPARDCLDASCRDHDQCYGDWGYLNSSCDRILCTNIQWCLQNGFCRTLACQAAAWFMMITVCGGVGRLPIIPFPPFPPNRPW